MILVGATAYCKENLEPCRGIDCNELGSCGGEELLVISRYIRRTRRHLIGHEKPFSRNFSDFHFIEESTSSFVIYLMRDR